MIEGKMTDETRALETLGARIKSERKSQGLTQTELANLAGVSLNFISQLESAKSTVRMDKVLQVIGILGMEFHIRYGKKGISQ